MTEAHTLSGGFAGPAAARPLSFVAVLAGSDVQAGLRSIAAQTEDVSALSPAEIIARHGAGMLVIAQGTPGWDQLLLQLALDQPTGQVIVLSDLLPAHMVRALMKIQASDILPAAAAPEEIAAAFQRLCDPSGGVSASPARSVCWAFRGAVGGAGVSTIAIESAFALARQVGPGKVCLIDLNLSDGMVASFLEAVAKLDLPALCAAPERLDNRLLAAWCWQHEDGVSVIAAPRDPEADQIATQEAILRLLDVACSSFEYVLLDMPRHMLSWTKAVLAGVDEAIIVSELTVPSLHAAADMCRYTDALRSARPAARLVLNRMFPKRKFNAGFALDKAEKAIGRQIDLTVSSDWDAARTAVNLGRPVAEVKPKSQLVADVAGLVSRLLPDEKPVMRAGDRQLRRASA